MIKWRYICYKIYFEIALWEQVFSMGSVRWLHPSTAYVTTLQYSAFRTEKRFMIIGFSLEMGISVENDRAETVLLGRRHITAEKCPLHVLDKIRLLRSFNAVSVACKVILRVSVLDFRYVEQNHFYDHIIPCLSYKVDACIFHKNGFTASIKASGGPHMSEKFWLQMHPKIWLSTI